MFAGDIMQHKPNYAYGNFDAIWEAVRSDISACSLAVANLETPVDASRPYDTYPNFNTHPEYVQAAIDAGATADDVVILEQGSHWQLPDSTRI